MKERGKRKTDEREGEKDEEQRREGVKRGEKQKMEKR
jgi:hypothetical protein